MKRTNEGAIAHEHSMDHGLEFFSKAGSLFVNKGTFYGNENSALGLFKNVWYADEELAFRLLLWLRDCRGGAGNRSGFRECIKWVAKQHGGVSWISENIEWIPEVGRWDDLRVLFDTPAKRVVSSYWANQLKERNVLSAKWADRKDKPLKHSLNIKEEGVFRRFLSSIRKKHIVEHKMSTKRWREIEYHTVPSLAMARYTNAFKRNDELRFERFKEKLVNGETKVNASALFPHDCVRTVKSGDNVIANEQFKALPNYLEGTDERILVICDTSGSMDVRVAGSIEAVDVSQALALYCSAKIPEESQFHKKFIGFSCESELVDWSNLRFSQAVKSRAIFNGAVGSTRIDKALKLILKTATFFKMPESLMPTTLLIVSDMQFHEGTSSFGWERKDKVETETEIERELKKFDKAGYARPKVVYWNLAGYSGAQATKHSKNVGLISGFSPSILKAVLGGTDFSPVGIMKRAIEKYEVKVPK